MKENQQTVSKWAQETFGLPGPVRSFERIEEELKELGHEVYKPEGDKKKIGQEAADVLMTLYAFAEVVGFDLHEETDEKMVINRERKWKVDGTGCGYHIKEDGSEN